MTNYANYKKSFNRCEKMTINRIDEKIFIELYNKGKNDVEISNYFNVNPVSVTRKRYKFGLKPNGLQIKISDEKVIELYSKGLNQREISRMFNMNSATISRRMKKLNLESNRPRQKITKEQVVELYNTDLSDNEIANELNVARSNICRLRRELNLPPIKNKLVEKKICPACENEFVRTSHIQKYCSDSCWKKVKNERIREKNKQKFLVRSKIKCIICDNEFIPKTKRHSACSYICKIKVQIERSKKKYWETHKIQLKSCLTCKTEFRKLKGDHKYCSKSCRIKGYRNYDKFYYYKNKIYRVMEERNCLNCDKGFMVGGKDYDKQHSKKFCSEKCRWTLWAKNNPEKLKLARRKAYYKDHAKTLRELHEYRATDHAKEVSRIQARNYARKNYEFKKDELFERDCDKCGRFGYYVIYWNFNKKTKKNSLSAIYCWHKKTGKYDACPVAQGRRKSMKFLVKNEVDLNTLKISEYPLGVSTIK